MRFPLLLAVALLAGCATPPQAEVAVAPEPATGPCCLETTTDAWQVDQPSAVVAGLTFLNPGTSVRDAPPAGLRDTVVEARIVPDEAAVGGISMGVFGGGSGGSFQVTFCGEKLAQADAPDADGVYRVRLAPGTWTDGELCILLESNGEPAGARQSVRVETWTTTTAGMDLPAGFTAVD